MSLGRAALIALVACSSPPAPAPQPTPAPPAPAPAPAPAPSKVDPFVALHALGVERVEKLAHDYADLEAGPDGDIIAVGPCTRPSDAERAALKKRVLAWIDTMTPKEMHDSAPDELRLAVGCVDPDGLVVDAAIDRKPRAGDRRIGHWWVLRIAPKGIDELVHQTGPAVTDWMEWVVSHTASTMLLADLDGDGTREVVVVKSEHEGGASASRFELDVIGRGAKSAGVSGSWASWSIVTRLPLDPKGTFLLAMRPKQGLAEYVCLPGGGSCPEAERAHRHDEAALAAEELAQLTPKTVPDRDELEKILVRLELREPERAPLLALVPATSPELRAERAIETVQRDRAAEQRELQDRLGADLGTARCAESKTEPPAARAWLRRRSPKATHVTVRVPCEGRRGTYAEVEWVERDRAFRALLFATAGGATVVAEAAGTYMLIQGGEDLRVEQAAAFHREGDALVGVVLSGHQLALVVDGVVTARSEIAGEPPAMYRETHELVVAGDQLLQATAGGLVALGKVPPAALRTPRVPANKALDRAIGAEIREAAWTTLRSANAEHLRDRAFRADVVLALQIVGAEPALRAAVEKLGAP